MGVREFDRWCEVTAASGPQTGPESWAGYESDPFWQEAHRR